MEKPRKAPAIEKSIDQIVETDIRVRVFGKIERQENNGFFLEDGGSRIKVNTDQKFELGKHVRVFGRPVKNEQGLAINSEFIQDMSLLDGNLYKKILSLINK